MTFQHYYIITYLKRLQFSSTLSKGQHDMAAAGVVSVNSPEIVLQVVN